MASEVPVSSDSPRCSAPVSVRVGEDGSRAPNVPSFHKFFHLPKFQVLCQILGTQKGTAQAASALEAHSSVEKTIQETDRDTKGAQSLVEAEGLGRLPGGGAIGLSL